MANSSLLPLTLAAAASLIFSVRADAQKTQTNNYGNGAGSDPFGGAPGMSSSSRPRPSASDDGSSNDSDTDDPTLTRMKTKDSLASGEMTRDEGELTRKVMRKEKVANVDTKQLPTSGSDSKFSGSLLQSSVGSIMDVSGSGQMARRSQHVNTDEKAHLNLQNLEPQANGDDGEKENAEPPAKNESDARFKARQLMMNGSTEENSKKTESPQTRADSSPSPSPSPNRTANPSSR